MKDVHPNTVLIKLKKGDKELEVTGSSIGGGNIVVHNIDGYEVNIRGNYPTLWVLHRDKPGEVGIITSILGCYKLNIAFMRVFRKKRGTIGSSIIELDQDVDEDIIDHLQGMKDILKVRYIPPL